MQDVEDARSSRTLDERNWEKLLIDIRRHESRRFMQDFEEAHLSAKKMLDEHNWNKLLFDVRSAADHVPFAGMYNVMISISKDLPLAKIVLVFPPERRKEGEFAETVATNRWMQLKSFWDYDAAVAWLTANPQ